jgi:hypothetical protein
MMVNDIREEAKEKEEGPAPDALHHHGMLDADASGEPPFEEHEFDTVRFIGNNDEDKGVGRLCIRERWVSKQIIGACVTAALISIIIIPRILSVCLSVSS